LTGAAGGDPSLHPQWRPRQRQPAKETTATATAAAKGEEAVVVAVGCDEGRECVRRRMRRREIRRKRYGVCAFGGVGCAVK